MRAPEFDELIGDDVAGAERERLRRAHDLLVAAGPPRELPPSLASAPSAQIGKVAVLPRRRRGALVLLAAALAVASFGAGYLVGGEEDGAAPRVALPRAERVVELSGAGDAVAVVAIGAEDAVGNRAMVVTVDGLAHLSGGDYYTLFMTKRGKPIATCGTFNVRGGARRTVVRLNVAYDPEGFDGLALAKYTHTDHKDRILLRGHL